MGKTASAASTRHMKSTRSGASKNLLARKAREHATAADDGETLEALFPPVEADASNQRPQAAAPSIEYIEPAAPSAGGAVQVSSPALPSWLEAPLVAAPAQSLPQAPSWSEKDEGALQAMLARRKAAGYQRRGRDVSGQLLRVGEVKPNANTVSATIVELVAGRGSVTRAELLDMMAVATFPHAKARPADRGWCQGWVAGALRDNFLALAFSEAAEETAQ